MNKKILPQMNTDERGLLSAMKARKINVHLCLSVDNILLLFSSGLTRLRKPIKYSLLAAFAVIFVAGCKKSGPAGVKQPPPPSAPSQAGQLIPDLMHTREIERITKRGILVARVRCDREPLCFHDEYGVPAGFEVDLLQKIARALGVKLNVVEDPNAPADIVAPALRPSPSTDDPALTSPYLFRAPDRWHCFRVESADPSLQAALDRLLRHLYETGTYQQVYINWFGKKSR